MSLTVTPISRNLKTSIRMLGLEIEDLLVVGLAAVFALILGGLIFPRSMSAFGMPMNWVCFFGILLIGIPGLMIFKYGKPRGYLKDFIAWHISSRIYSGLEPDPVIKSPFIEELCDDEPKPTKGAKTRA